jgi:hypothetical protein
VAGLAALVAVALQHRVRLIEELPGLLDTGAKLVLAVFDFACVELEARVSHFRVPTLVS